MQLVTKDEGNASQFQEDHDGVEALPRNPMESEIFRCQHRSWTQTEAQETDDIDQQRQQRANEMQRMME